MFFIGMIALILLVDLGIKDTIEEADATAFPKEMEGTGGKIVLYQNHNDGFPFGLFRSQQELVRSVPLVITSALGGIFFWLCQRKGQMVEKMAVSMMLGGALSNLYDRLVRHYVVDYFSIQWKNLKKVVFNLGDIFIFLGTGILLVNELIHIFREK
ncbi:MAG: signal peptidase II [Hungatella sp.]